MKTSKRISALLLAICLLAGMAVPMVSAEAPQVTRTVTYDFDYITIRQEAGITKADNGLTSSVVQGYINNTLYGNYINWNYAASSFADSGRLYAFNAKGYLFCRALEGDWVAFAIDNPGAGDWNVELKMPGSKYSARKLNVYIMPKTENMSADDIKAGITSANLEYTVNCNASTSTEQPEKGVNVATYSFDWKAETASSYVVVFEVAQASTNQIQSKNAAHIYLSALTMTKSSTDAAAEINDAILGSKLTLQSSVTTEEALMLKNGVTLDLNGQALNAASMNCVKGSQIMDSSENDSAVVTVTGSFAAGANNKELPLKIAAKS